MEKKTGGKLEDFKWTSGFWSGLQVKKYGEKTRYGDEMLVKPLTTNVVGEMEMGA